MIERMLAEARSRIVRYSPAEAAGSDALLVDLRCADERRRDGVIPGSVHVPRSVLEWRCDPESSSTNPHLVGRRLILVCHEGYSSSLAAATLLELGVDAGDLDGGFEAWRACGSPVVPAKAHDGARPGMGGPE